MKKDFFSILQDTLVELPEGLHMAAFALLLMLYAFLCFGFWMERRKHKRHVKVYFVIRTSLIMLYMFMKASDSGFGMFDRNCLNIWRECHPSTIFTICMGLNRTMQKEAKS